MCKDEIKIADAYVRKAKSSKDRGIKFELTFAQFKKLYKTMKCAYSGKKLEHNSTWSIDRMDGAEGYTFENSVVCSKELNGRKGNLTINEIKQFIRVWEKKNLLKK